LKEKILEMLNLQERLNSKINENWRKERTKEDFVRAIWIECAELVDSLPWKWWKKQEPNMNNVQIEVVDIWHFILSYILLDCSDIAKALESDYIKYFEKGLNENFEHLKINGSYINHYLGETDKYKKIIFLTERVAEGFLKDSPEEGIFFFGLLVKNTLSLDKLYLLYIGKNILNHIRQETGYKDGSYKKVINGMEDNEYLFNIVEKVKSKEELETEIRKIFKTLQEVN